MDGALGRVSAPLLVPNSPHIALLFLTYTVIHVKYLSQCMFALVGVKSDVRCALVER